MGNLLNKVNTNSEPTSNEFESKCKYLEYVGKTPREAKKLMKVDYPTMGLRVCSRSSYYNEVYYTNSLRALVEYGRIVEITMH